MSKHKDKLILELLKQRVLDRDKELEQQEYHKATKEALVEMTSLSKTEVDALYRQVKTEVDEADKKKRKKLIIIGVAVAVVALIFVPKLISALHTPVVFVEEFDSNTNSWSFSNVEGSGQYPEEHQFVFNVQKEGDKIEYIDHAIALPEHYSIEIDAKKLSGNVDSYGLYIGTNANNFGYFFLKSNGDVRYGFSIGGKWQDNPDWATNTAVIVGENSVNKLKVVVKGNEFQYFINGTLIAKGNMFGLKATQYSVAVAGKQIVAFDNLKITDLTKNSVVFENPFDAPLAPWTEKRSVEKHAEFKDGGYEMEVNIDDYCYWATAWIPKEFEKIDDYELILTARILRREKGDGTFGLMYLLDNETYHTFEVKNGNQARMCTVVSGTFEYTGLYSGEQPPSDKAVIKIVRKDGEIEYYYNGLLVDKLKRDSWITWDDMDKIGLRVCNFQTIKFEKLEIRELK